MANTATEIERQVAVMLGRLAARTGRPMTACPYPMTDRDDADGRNRQLALGFVQGYRSTQPPGSGVIYT